MDRKELETQVLNMVAMSYKQDIKDISVSTSFKEDLGGASVQMVALVSEIENELDVEIMLSEASACATIKRPDRPDREGNVGGCIQSNRKEPKWVYLNRFMKSKGKSQRIAFPEAVNEKMMQAAYETGKEGYIIPVLVGNADEIREALSARGYEEDIFTIVDIREEIYKKSL